MSEHGSKCLGCMGVSVPHTGGKGCVHGGHPAAKLLRELAEVAEWHSEPWKEFEAESDGRYRADWVRLHSFFHLLQKMEDGKEIRRRPRTVRVSGEVDEKTLDMAHQWVREFPGNTGLQSVDYFARALVKLTPEEK